MSRDSDIKALKQLKTDLNEAEAYAEIAKEEWDEANRIKAEMDNTKFVFKPLPTNNAETAKAGFKKKWKDFFSNTRKFKMVFLVLYSLAMAAFAVLLFIDAFKNSCTIFNSPHQWNETATMVLTGALAAAFPIAAGIFPWVIAVSSDYTFDFLKTFGIALVVSGVLFAVLCDWTNSFHLLLIIAGAAVAAIIVGLIIQLIFVIVSKIPIMTVKQRAILAAEKQKDIDNAEANKVNEVKEKEEWEAWWADYRPKLRETGLEHISRGDVAMEKAKAHLKAAEESDILGNTEKDEETIDWLIHFIESRRADSIKEALHEFDAMKQNQKMLEVEAIKAQIEIERAKKENSDRQYQIEMNRRHQIEMEAQAKRNADMQSQIAANTAAAAASAERLRKDAAAAAADAAATQARVAADINAIYRNEYYNS